MYRCHNLIRQSIVLSLMGLPMTAATLTVYLSPPGTTSLYQSSSVAGVTTENFNSLTPGLDTVSTATTVGTFQLSGSSALKVLPFDQYGGANQSDYISFGAQSGTSAPVTLNLIGDETYFGMWWSAGDSNNGISFYKNNLLLVRFSTADLITLLTPTSGKVTAINGVQYTNSQYYGNPNNTSQDTGEPFSYVNFVASGQAFNKLVFDNSGTTSTGFEMDNFSILASGAVIPTTHVLVETLPAASTPEPNVFLPFAIFLTVLPFSRSIRVKRS